MARVRKTAGQVLELMNANGGLPDENELLAQGFRFYPRHWLSKWEPSMPDIPPILRTGVLDARGRKRLSRRDLFTLGQEVETVADAIEFYVAVCSWGAGNRARDIYRRIGPLQHPEAGDRLLQGIRSVQGPMGSATAGYRTFCKSDAAYLKGLGPAFFTKLLYFSAGETLQGRTRPPLILDQKVAKAIGWPAKTWWTAEEYADYLDLVDGVRKLIDPLPRADSIEYALFSVAT